MYYNEGVVVMVMLRDFIGRFALPFLCILWLAGCNNSDRIDASSSEAFKTSIEKITGKLPEEERVSFRKALSILTIRHLDLKAVMSGKVPASEASTDALRQVLDGRTVAEVIKMGDEALVELQSRRAAAQQAINQRQRPSPLLPKPPQQPPAPAQTVPQAPQS
jgi:uncharacterized membrane protein